MARVKGGTPRSTPSTTGFPAATAFTRSRGEMPVNPSSGDSARRRSASPAASRSRQSRSRSQSQSQHDDDAETIVATPLISNPADNDGPADQLLQETRSVSLGAAGSDESDDKNGQNKDEKSSEGGYEEAQDEEDGAQDVETESAREPELAAEDADGRPDEGEFEVEKICSFQLAEIEAPAGRAAAKETPPPPTAPAVLLEIKWRGYPWAANTFEPEADVQASAGPLLYKFWAAQGGRDKALQLNPQTAVYVPFRILKPVVTTAPAAAGGWRRRGKRRGRPKMPRYLVQWVGYNVDEATPETERKLRDVAPALLDHFLSDNPAAAFSPRFPE